MATTVVGERRAPSFSSGGLRSALHTELSRSTQKTLILTNDYDDTRRWRHHLTQGSRRLGVMVGDWHILLSALERALGLKLRDSKPGHLECIILLCQAVREMKEQGHERAMRLFSRLSDDPVRFGRKLLFDVNEVRHQQFADLPGFLGGCEPVHQLARKRVDFAVQVAKTYERLLDVSGKPDDTLRLKLVLQRSGDELLVRPFERVIIASQEVTYLESRLLEWLVTAGMQVVTHPNLEVNGCTALTIDQTQTDSTQLPVEFYLMESAHDEIDAAVDYICKDTANGTPLNELAVICPDTHYLERTRARLDQFGIPCWGAAVFPLTENPLIQVWHSFLNLSAGVRSLTDFATVILDDGCKWSSLTSRENLVRSLSEQWPIRADDLWSALEAWVQKSFEEAEWQDKLSLVKRDLAPILDSWHESPALEPKRVSASELEQTWAVFALFIMRNRLTQGFSAGSAVEVHQLLKDAVQQAISICNALEVDGFSVPAWMDLLTGVIGTQVKGENVQQGVHLVLQDPGQALHSEHALVLGFSQDTYPRRPSVPVLLGQLERELMRQQENRSRLQTIPDQVAMGALQFNEALSGFKGWHAFVPTRRMSGQGVEPSWLMQKQAVKPWPLLSCQPQAGSVPSFPGSGDFRSHIGAHALSPSALDKLLACPYKYHVENMLRLRDYLLTQPLDVTPLDEGVVVHAVIESAFSSGAGWQDCFAQWFDAAVDANTPRLLLPHLQYRLRVLRKDTKDFIARLTEFLSDHQLEVVECELAFGIDEPVLLQLPGALFPIPFRGRADLLARSGDGLYLVFDFKRGEVDKYLKRAKHGLETQMSIYPEAIAQATGAKPDLGVYYSIRKAGSTVSFMGERCIEQVHEAHRLADFTAKSCLLEPVVESLSERLTQLIDQLSEPNARFRPIPTKEQYDFLRKARLSSCEYCDIAPLCQSCWKEER